LLEDLGIDLEFDAKHQFRPLVRGLDGLRGELRVSGDEADARRNDIVGDRIEDDASVVADREPTRVRSGQEDRHVDVGEVEDGDDRRAGGDDLASPGKLVLDPSQPGRHEGQIIDD
jgi:hypothetical protein